MKIIFMGTPNFALPTLEKLIANDYFEIVGVFTREPKNAGRGQKIQNSPIHNLAIKNGLKVFTPKTLKTKETQEDFLNLNADACVVVAYGLILPNEIINGCKFGCFNIHPSALPKWRGASPIQRTIMNLDEKTDICIIKMDEGLDSGDVVLRKEFLLNGCENYFELEEKFAKIGAEMTIEVLLKAENKNLPQEKQNDAFATYAKKIEKAECEIDFTKSAKEVDAKIRALNGSLGAFFNFDEERIKIFSCKIIDEKAFKGKIGEVLNEDFYIQCGQGIIQPQILQKAGKSKVTIKEFLLGNF